MIIRMPLQTVIRAVLEMTTNVTECAREPSICSLLPADPAYVSTFRRPMNQNSVDALEICRSAWAGESARSNKLESSKTSNSWLPCLWWDEIRSVAKSRDDPVEIFPIDGRKGIIP